MGTGQSDVPRDLRPLPAPKSAAHAPSPPVIAPSTGLTPSPTSAVEQPRTTNAPQQHQPAMPMQTSWATPVQARYVPAPTKPAANGSRFPMSASMLSTEASFGSHA